MLTRDEDGTIKYPAYDIERALFIVGRVEFFSFGCD